MYVWIGCKLPDDFSAVVRSHCIPVGRALGADLSGFTLPQHISLKISFDAGDMTEAILDQIEEQLRGQPVFSVVPEAPEPCGEILWIPIRENRRLRYLHDLLDEQLCRFGIEPHLYDKSFYFHSTLLTGAEEKLRQAAKELWDLPVPDEMMIDTILLGVSPTGRSGDYHVVREIKLHT